jgi:hypothetical protein
MFTAGTVPQLALNGSNLRSCFDSRIVQRVRTAPVVWLWGTLSAGSSPGKKERR